jgi:hypothetical protein
MNSQDSSHMKPISSDNFSNTLDVNFYSLYISD